MEYATLALSIIGLVIVWFWLKKPDDKKDRFYAIFSLVCCTLMMGLSIWAILARL